MTSEDEDRIVLKVIEKVLNLMPEVIGNLMAVHSSNTKIKDDFYIKHSEFKSHVDIVKRVVSKVESENLGKGYDEVLRLSVPIISEQIRLKSTLDFKPLGGKESLKLNIPPDDQFGEL